MSDTQPMLPAERVKPVEPLCSMMFFTLCVVPLTALGVYLGVEFGPAWFWKAAVGLLVVLLITLLAIGLCFLQSFQIWALQRPRNLIARLILPLIEVAEGMADLHPYYEKLRLAWGPNFCMGGMVCLGEWATIEKALTQPQARTDWLGTHPLINAHLPKTTEGRMLFLLSLSNQGAGGNGDHEAFRKCLAEYVFVPSANEKRRKDDTARRLLEEVAKDYSEMPNSYGDSFWTSKERGLTPFLVKYLHHILFNMDITNKADVEALIEWHAGEKHLAHYMVPAGYCFDCTPIIERLTPLYEKCPCFSDFKENNPAFGKLTRRDAALLMLTIMRIAGIQGTHLACMIAMGGVHLPAYPGHATYDIDVRKTWDSLDLNDRETIENYVFEVTRLAAPVSTSHRVATEDFTTTIKGKQYTFPTGTKIIIPLCMGSTDTSVWGEDAFDLKLNRPKLCPHHMAFNSVGERNNGRMCPGKDVAIATISDLLQALGKTRTRAN